MRLRTPRIELLVLGIEASEHIALLHHAADFDVARDNLPRYAKSEVRLVARAHLAGITDAAGTAAHGHTNDADEARYGLRLRRLFAPCTRKHGAQRERENQCGVSVTFPLHLPA